MVASTEMMFSARSNETLDSDGDCLGDNADVAPSNIEDYLDSDFDGIPDHVTMTPMEMVFPTVRCKGHRCFRFIVCSFEEPANYKNKPKETAGIVLDPNEESWFGGVITVGRWK